MKEALIIFARNPIAGKVKTRLAATMGDDKALSIYSSLLQHTSKVCGEVSCDRFVFYADGISLTDMWNNTQFIKKNQEGNDLGEKMSRAFESIFNEHYDKILIIGTDCFELTSAIIQKAFNDLQQYDAIIGPSADGGYYLLGMKKYYPFLFQNKNWSTATVYETTIQDFIKHQIHYTTLPVLNDIDTESDWNLHLTKHN